MRFLSTPASWFHVSDVFIIGQILLYDCTSPGGFSDRLTVYLRVRDARKLRETLLDSSWSVHTIRRYGRQCHSWLSTLCDHVLGYCPYVIWLTNY